jgi:serine phosphatase RsbU (regulator of sigma subunit)
VTAVIIHCIVRNKVVEEWSEGSDVAELVQHRLEQEMRDRIEQGLRVARRIQQASLSKEVPELEGWQIGAHYQPAKEVGGDFCDFLELPNGHLGFFVGTQ